MTPERLKEIRAEIEAAWGDGRPLEMQASELCDALEEAWKERDHWKRIAVEARDEQTAWLKRHDTECLPQRAALAEECARIAVERDVARAKVKDLREAPCELCDVTFGQIDDFSGDDPVLSQGPGCWTCIACYEKAVRGFVGRAEKAEAENAEMLDLLEGTVRPEFAESASERTMAPRIAAFLNQRRQAIDNPGEETCAHEGCAEKVAYHNYLGVPLCWPHANGERTMVVPHDPSKGGWLLLKSITFYEDSAALEFWTWDDRTPGSKLPPVWVTREQALTLKPGLIYGFEKTQTWEIGKS